MRPAPNFKCHTVVDHCGLQHPFFADSGFKAVVHFDESAFECPFKRFDADPFCSAENTYVVKSPWFRSPTFITLSTSFDAKPDSCNAIVQIQVAGMVPNRKLKRAGPLAPAGISLPD